MVPASLKGQYVIRFTVTSQYTRDDDIERDWAIIKRMATKILAAEIGENTVTEAISDEKRVEQIRRKREVLRRKDFGLSLILSNVPMSPKFINGSFAAMFDSPGVDIIGEYAKYISRKNIDLNGCPMRMSPRKKFEEKKRQISFDQNHLFPKTTMRPVYQALRQGSLDSKIEEIFQISAEGDETEGDETYPESNGKEEVIRRNPKPAESALEESKSGGMNPSKMCKHCGWKIED